MKHTVVHEGFTVTTDPNNKHEQDYHAIIEQGGFLPGWLIAYELEPIDDSLQDHMAKAYGYGLFPMGDKSGITDELVHTYPGDPDLQPLFTFDFSNGAQFVFYQYAICAMRQSPDDKWFVTRMD